MTLEIKTTNEIKLMKLSNWHDEDDFTDSDKRWVSVETMIHELVCIEYELNKKENKEGSNMIRNLIKQLKGEKECKNN